MISTLVVPSSTCSDLLSEILAGTGLPRTNLHTLISCFSFPFLSGFSYFTDITPWMLQNECNVTHGLTFPCRFHFYARKCEHFLIAITKLKNLKQLCELYTGTITGLNLRIFLCCPFKLSWQQYSQNSLNNLVYIM